MDGRLDISRGAQNGCPLVVGARARQDRAAPVLVQPLGTGPLPRPIVGRHSRMLAQAKLLYAGPLYGTRVGSHCLRNLCVRHIYKGGVMLFHVSWAFVDTSEEGQRRSLAVFAEWQPPAGAEFKGFYGFTD